MTHQPQAATPGSSPPAWPPDPSATPVQQNGQTVPPLPTTPHVTAHQGTSLPPLFEMGTEYMKLESIALDDIRLSPLHCHRDMISQERLDKLAKRIKALVQLPPLRGWRAPDGAVILTDGFHRFLALRQLEVNHASVLVWHGTWPEALVQALMANTPHNERVRKGQDAERALLILAHVLGRSVTADECAVLGLEWTPNREPTPDLVRIIRLPAELEMAATAMARKARTVAVNNSPPRRPPPCGKRPAVSRRS